MDAANEAILSGGPLGSDTYRVLQFNFHFGNTSLPASEHAFDGVRTTGEVWIYIDFIPEGGQLKL